MPVETTVRFSGSHRIITQPEVKFGGVWREMTTIEVKSGGVWRTVFEIGAGNVTVSGETFTDFGVNRTARAALVVRADGTIDKIVNVTTTQIDSSTDWIIPNGDASSLYDVRYTGLTGDPLDASSSLNEDEWGALSSDMFFEQRALVGTGDAFSSTFTIQVRFNGGAVLDSASYTIGATNIIL